MTTLSIPLFLQRVDRMHGTSCRYFVLVPINLNKTIKVEVTRQSLIQQLKDRSPNTVVEHYRDRQTGDLIIGFTAQDFKKSHTLKLKSQWEQKMSQRLKDIEAIEAITSNWEQSEVNGMDTIGDSIAIA